MLPVLAQTLSQLVLLCAMGQHLPYPTKHIHQAAPRQPQLHSSALRYEEHARLTWCFLGWIG